MAAVDITSRYEDLCRLCAMKTTALLSVNIFAQEGAMRQVDKKIESCFPFQVHRSDGLPKMICEHCLYKLELFFDFKERAVRTQTLLLEIFEEINTNKVQNDHHLEKIQSVDIVGINHSDFLTTPHQILPEHTIQNQLNSHIGQRSNVIVNSEMLLVHQNVGINAHHLDALHQELTNSGISEHSLEDQETIVPDEANSLQNTHYSESEMHILHQSSEILNEHYGMHEELTSTATLTDDSQETRSLVDMKMQNSNCNEELTADSNVNNSLNSLNGQDTCNSENASSFCGDGVKEEHNNDDSFVGRNFVGIKEPESVISQNEDWYHYERDVNKCNVCSEEFSTVESLTQHQQIHLEVDNKNEITQSQNSSLPKTEESDEDDRTESNEQVEATEECGETAKRKKWSPKVCTDCGKSFKNNYKLTEHMRKHTGEKPYKCSSCEKAFRSKIGLAQHEAKHTGQYDFACPTCGKGFQCKSYLMVHQRVHSDVKPYPCTTCGRNFKTKQSLLDHTNRHLGVKPFVCEICGRGFITKGLCKAHQKVHTGTDNRKYSCKVCNKMFVSKSYLQTHLRIHTGEKPFMCEVCGKGFLTRVDLRIHSTMHTGEKSYVCEMCGKAFARRDALHCHRRSHTGERPYSCDQCGQTFTQFSPMAIHKRLHTGERPYTCEVCGKKFVSKSTMMSHSKKHVR